MRIEWPVAVAALSLAGLLVACGGGAQGAKAPGEDSANAVASFQALEDEVLRDLATIDRRIAVRGRITPREDDLRRLTMSAVLAEDPSLAVIDGFIDPFSFEVRGRGLAATRKKVEAAPASLPDSAGGMVPSPSLEKEILIRTVDEELVRLEEERALPRSASALLRGIIETWTPPANPDATAARDRWLSRRLGEVFASLTTTPAGGAPLDVVRARELDDTLDALEHAIDAPGFGQSTKELVKLREALEGLGTRPSAAASSDWTLVARRVRAHLGYELTAEALDAKLEARQKTLKAAAEAAVAKAGLGTDALAAKVAPLVLATTACVDAVPGSRVRSLAPPPERMPACHLRHVAAAVNDDASRAIALVVMHDHVVVARWALDVARGTATIGQTTGRRRPISHPGPEVTAHWERIALARPAVAIGGGLAAGVIYGETGNDFASIGKRWIELGEMPFDIAEREIAKP